MRPPTATLASVAAAPPRLEYVVEAETFTVTVWPDTVVTMIAEVVLLATVPITDPGAAPNPGCRGWAPLRLAPPSLAPPSRVPPDGGSPDWPGSRATPRR